jgi:hypothetical protein
MSRTTHGRWQQLFVQQKAFEEALAGKGNLFPILLYPLDLRLVYSVNLSIIQRTIRQGDLSVDAARYLIGCRGECEWLDYKQDLHLEHDKELCDFTRDAIALKNVGGGFILVGVRDKSWELIGLPTRLAYDAKLPRDQVRRSSSLELEIDIVHHEIYGPHAPRLVALVHVRGSKKWRKRRAPTMVGKDFCAKQPYTALSRKVEPHKRNSIR